MANNLRKGAIPHNANVRVRNQTVDGLKPVNRAARRAIESPKSFKGGNAGFSGSIKKKWARK